MGKGIVFSVVIDFTQAGGSLSEAAAGQVVEISLVDPQTGQVASTAFVLGGN